MKNNDYKFFILALIAGVAVLVTGCATNVNTTSETNTNTNVNTPVTNTVATNTATANTNVAADPAGTIVVEAGNGTLTGVQKSTMDYLGESARGLEAYLGSGGATANYNVTATTAGTYVLWIKLSDDGVWPNGSRSATVYVNGSAATVRYSHVSENTNGWKWYSLGNITLKAGNNTIAFTKDASTQAAFVMDEFKLVPQQ